MSLKSLYIKKRGLQYNMQNIEKVSKKIENGNNKKTSNTITKFFTYINREKPSISAITRKYSFEEIELKKQ